MFFGNYRPQTDTCLSVILFTGGCLPQCMMGYTPLEADTRWEADPPRSACWEIPQQAGGTHPTGMHTCLEKKSITCPEEK